MIDLFFASNAWAQTSGAPARTNAPVWPMLIGLFAIFYFFLIRPQQKKQKELRSMLDSLAKGDRVITIGGILGTVVTVKEKRESKTEDDVIVLKVGDATKIEVIRSSIARVVSREGDTQQVVEAGKGA